MKVLLICGGKSSENKISRMSALNIRKYLNKYDLTKVVIDSNGKWYQTDEINISDNYLDNGLEIDNIIKYLKEFDVVFPALHGIYGEDGTIQGLFEIAGVPYVGLNVFASSLTMNKIYTKRYLERFDIPVVPYLFVQMIDNKYYIIGADKKYENINEIVREKLDYPVFVKASNGGSSIGSYKVLKEDDLIETIKKASIYDKNILIEKYINARELECAILGNNDLIVSEVGEIIPHGDFYSYESKYTDKESKVRIPALINNDDKIFIQNLAKKIFTLIGGTGLSRIDFFLDKNNGKIYLNEINGMPGFTDISMYPLLIKNLGISGEELCDKLINLAIERFKNE